MKYLVSFLVGVSLFASGCAQGPADDVDQDDESVEILEISEDLDLLSPADADQADELVDILEISEGLGLRTLEVDPRIQLDDKYHLDGVQMRVVTIDEGPFVYTSDGLLLILKDLSHEMLVENPSGSKEKYTVTQPVLVIPADRGSLVEVDPSKPSLKVDGVELLDEYWYPGTYMLLGDV